jgi:prepilin-type N-terminal cleavage/methylation domain-containing protein
MNRQLGEACSLHYQLRISDFGLRIGDASRIRNRRAHRGFTLLEMVLAMAVTSVILLGIGSAMLIAGRAMPDAHSPAADSVAGADAIEQMVAELQYAVSINQRSARMIEFTVADRNGDGTPEVIHYEWSGVTGDSLTRQYNAGTAAEVLSNIQDFTLSYDLQTISTQIPQGNESAETLLIGYNSSSYYSDYTVKNDAWYSEYFRPVLPANTVSWKVTRVRFYAMQSGGATGQTKVQLQTPTVGGLPSGIVLEEKSLQESGLWLLYLLQELTYTQVSGLSPQQGLCLVFGWASGDDGSCKLLGQNQGVTASNLALLKSTNKAVTWSSLPGQSLLFWVYGTVTTAGTPQIQNTYYLNGVGIRLKTGTDDRATVQTSVRIVNKPEVTQ